ncbi:acyl carrier protein [Priestia filamentosa]|uniref:acyl carrier protein n=1 Tax=Priestia TaxID=2800373 RepID=UPI002280D7B0|nr:MULTISPECIES: acyl carrier protein [Priestia]MCY8235301.1 acyl carrier protein [Priestia endophytica]MED3729530.1 acyl carrier protein [Priestia filamentosa]
MKTEINDIMLQIGFETQDLNDDFSLIDDLGIDSTELVELAFQIKDKLNILLTLEELKALENLRDLYNLVELKGEDTYAKNK